MKQHLIPNFLLKNWGYNFKKNDRRNFKCNILKVDDYFYNLYSIKPDIGVDFIIQEDFYENAETEEFLIEKKFFSKLENDIALINKKIIKCAEENIQVELNWKENFLLKIFFAISYFRTEKYLQDICFVKKNLQKILNFEPLENPELFDHKSIDNIEIYKESKLHISKKLLEIKNIFEYIKENKGDILIEDLAKKMIFDFKDIFFNELRNKFVFDREFHTNLISTYEYDDKIIKIFNQQLSLETSETFYFIQNLFYNTNLNILKFNKGKLFLSESIVNTWIDNSNNTLTYMFLPITPNIGLSLINSILSSKETLNKIKKIDLDINSSWEKLRKYIKNLFIDNSDFTSKEITTKESLINFNRHDDGSLNDFLSALNNWDRRTYSFKRNVKENIKYNFLNVEKQISFFNDWATINANNFIITSEDDMKDIVKYSFDHYKIVLEVEPELIPSEIKEKIDYFWKLYDFK